MPRTSTTARKPTARRRTRHVDRHDRHGRADVDVISQVKCARRHPWAAVLGGAVGGLPPWLGQTMAHHEIHGITDPKVIAVIGCMLFSCTTVYLFGTSLFRDPRKAAGFVAALELSAVLTSLWYIQLVAMVAIVSVNALVTGAKIALAYEATVRRSEAAQRAARTRAEDRADRRAAQSGARPASPVQTPVAWPPAAMAVPAVQAAPVVESWVPAPRAARRAPCVTSPAPAPVLDLVKWS